MLTPLPNRENERREQALPNAWEPAMLLRQPNREKLRRLIDDPTPIEPNTDVTSPTRTKPRTDIEEPMLPHCVTDSEPPTRPKLLTDMQLPDWADDRMDIREPMRMLLRTLRLEPNNPNDNTDKWLPIREKPRRLTLLDKVTQSITDMLYTEPVANKPIRERPDPHRRKERKERADPKVVAWQTLALWDTRDFVRTDILLPNEILPNTLVCEHKYTLPPETLRPEPNLA
jgi:hypothetical protein